MRRKPAVHIFEWSDSKGFYWSACMRRRNKHEDMVGRAIIMEGKRTGEITCKHCRKAYNLPPLKEPS